MPEKHGLTPIYADDLQQRTLPEATHHEGNLVRTAENSVAASAEDFSLDGILKMKSIGRMQYIPHLRSLAQKCGTRSV